MAPNDKVHCSLNKARKNWLDNPIVVKNIALTSARKSRLVLQFYRGKKKEKRSMIWSIGKGIGLESHIDHRGLTSGL